MSKAAKAIFLIDAIASLVIGAFLLIIPGRTLTAIGWVPFDPLMTRLLGAALLALAWGSFRGWRATQYQQVAILVEVQAIFATLGAIGLLRHLLIAWFPPLGWITFGLLAVTALAWGFVWLRRPRSS
jgi:hypothetical protein